MVEAVVGRVALGTPTSTGRGTGSAEIGENGTGVPHRDRLTGATEIRENGAGVPHRDRLTGATEIRENGSGVPHRDKPTGVAEGAGWGVGETRVVGVEVGTADRTPDPVPAVSSMDQDGLDAQASMLAVGPGAGGGVLKHVAMVAAIGEGALIEVGVVEEARDGVPHRIEQGQRAHLELVSQLRNPVSVRKMTHQLQPGGT